MYRCPNCKDLSISAISQLSPPFNGHTKCPTCGSEVKVKHKASNYLIFIFALTYAILGSNGIRLDITTVLIMLAIVAAVQIRLTEYVIVKPK